MRARDADLIASPRNGEPLERADLLVGEALGPIGDPGRIEAIHLANRAVFAEAVDDGHEIGHRRRAIVGEHRELEVTLGRDAPPHHRIPGCQHAEERACAPALQSLPFGGSSVFCQGRLGLFAFPAKRPTFVNGMESVDEQDHARELHPGGGGETAKALKQGGLGPAFESGLGEPARKLCNLRFGHGRIIAAAGTKANVERQPAPARK
jgi:hypothetical protein